MIILGIETSCDETAAAVLEVSKNSIKILSNIVSSQIKIHAPYGGVVPMLASRAHLENIIPVLEKAIEKSKKKSKDIDLIAVTRGPGLFPALVVGVNVARALSYVWKKPIVGVNHIEAHIFANLLTQIGEKSKIQNPKSKINSKFKIPARNASRSEAGGQNSKQIEFPAICLVVSGGHTQLILMKNFGKYKILGQTLDDAAGEAFDKVARILGLGYPGGSAIAAEAAKFPISNFQFPINLPRPMINSKDYDFSFSGLKTAVLYLVKNLTKKYSLEDIRPRVSFEFQEAVVDVLSAKAVKAVESYKVKTLMLGGGVAANELLRRRLKERTRRLKVNFSSPSKKFCLDNGAMVALTGYYRWIAGDFRDWRSIKTKADLRL